MTHEKVAGEGNSEEGSAGGGAGRGDVGKEVAAAARMGKALAAVKEKAATLMAQRAGSLSRADAVAGGGSAIAQVRHKHNRR